MNKNYFSKLSGRIPGIITCIFFMSICLNIQAQDVIKKTYTYKTAGDLKIQADVYRLPGDQVRPAIFWIHGGALIMGNREKINREQAKRYLNAGYTIISIDYRLAPQAKLYQIIEDLEDAWKWVRTEGPGLFRVDPSRIAVIGHSAGGYLSLMSGFVLKPAPRAIVSFYGYGDIAGDWYSKPDPYYSSQPAVTKEEAYKSVSTAVISDDKASTRDRFYLYCRQHGLWPLEVTGHDPVTEPKIFDKYCPLRNVTKNYPSTLLLHGDKDTDVPYEQSVMMEKELKRNGVNCELITMKGREHGFDAKMDDAEVSRAFERVLDFLDKWLKP